jgi:TonB family protein
MGPEVARATIRVASRARVRTHERTLSLAIAAMIAVVCAASSVHAQPSSPPALVEGEPPTADAPSHVIVIVVVDSDGSVRSAEPAQAGDEALDHRAVEAVARWRFAPARQDDIAVTARVRIDVRFRVNTPPSPSDDAQQVADIEAAEAPTYSASGAVDPIAESAAPRSASDIVISGDQVRAAPRRDAIDVLSTVPGVYVARVHGDGGAPAISLRGFDADHGQDIEFTLSGVPLNEPSNVHGQGYTDINWLMPEILSGIRVSEGVHDPRQGDFAIAGSIDLTLGVARRGLLSRTSYGSFDSFRQALVWAPPGEREGTFAAASYRVTRGYGIDHFGDQAALVLQSESMHEHVRLRVLGLVHASRYALPQIVRYADVGSLAPDFYGGYTDRAAAFPLIASLRARASAIADVDLGHGSFVEAMLWGAYGDLLVRGNYTGYATVSADPDPDVRARGDRFQQADDAIELGLGGRWHGERVRVADWLHGFVEIGARGRFASRQQSHGLATAPANVVWRPSVDAAVRFYELATFVDLDLHLGDVVRLRGGARAEVMGFDVDDHLAMTHASPVNGFVGPRVSLEVQALRGPSGDLVLAASYGQGLRSPQGVLAGQMNNVPIAHVESGDVGLRFSHGAHGELALNVVGFISALSDEQLFAADGGGLQTVGPSTRIGAATTLTTRPLPWLRGMLSATYVRATLDAPPTAEPGAPVEFRAGDPLPYLAPLTVRAEASVDEQVAQLGDHGLRLRASAGFSFLSPRPLPFEDVARALGVLDLGAGIAWGPIDLDLDVFNALDQRFAAQEYSMPATWMPSATAETAPSRSFTAGYPLTALVTLGLRVP